jgi:hypothetical protein
MDENEKILTSGLGGGLDSLNASLLYYSLKPRYKSMLGSVRPCSINLIENCRQFSESGCLIDKNSKIKKVGRYCEPKISKYLNEEMVFFSTSENKDSALLKKAFLDFRDLNQMKYMFFVDGGGDSLIFRSEDACDESEETDPFLGGDSICLKALDGIVGSYLAVVSVGLDIKSEYFMKNLDRLSALGAYYGKVNLASGKTENFLLEELFDFKKENLEKYFDLAENILVLSEIDLKNKNKTKSHTAVVTYHALMSNFGIKRTYVDWEPKTDGKPGVLVKPEHQWMYFFKADRLHKLKEELNIK